MDQNKHIPLVDLSYTGSLDSQWYIDYLKEHIRLLNGALAHAVEEADGWYDDSWGMGPLPSLEYIRSYLRGSK